MTKPQFIAQELDSERWLELEIRPFDEDAGRILKATWHRLSCCVQDQSRFENSDIPYWTSWLPFQWGEQTTSGRIPFVAWDDKRIAGILNLRKGFGSQVNSGTTIVYIEHLATFPGNIATGLWSQRISGVGVALLAFTASYASENGSQGFGLHSMPQVIEYYRNLKDRVNLEFTELGTGVPGPFAGNVEQVFFEASPAQALAFLDGYTNE